MVWSGHMWFSRYHIEPALRPTEPGPIPIEVVPRGCNHGTTRASASNMADRERQGHPPRQTASSSFLRIQYSTIVICGFSIQIFLLLVKALGLAIKINRGKRRDADRLSRLLHDCGTCMTNPQLRRYRCRIPAQRPQVIFFLTLLSPRAR